LEWYAAIPFEPDNEPAQQALAALKPYIDRFEGVGEKWIECPPVGMSEPPKGTYLYKIKSLWKAAKGEKREFLATLYDHLNALYVEKRVYEAYPPQTRQSVPDNMVMVPKEPSRDTIIAIGTEIFNRFGVMGSGGYESDIYRAMISAAEKESK